MKTSFDYTAIFFFAYGLILFTFNCGCNFNAENTIFKKELAKLSKQEGDPMEIKTNEELMISNAFSDKSPFALTAIEYSKNVTLLIN